MRDRLVPPRSGLGSPTTSFSDALGGVPPLATKLLGRERDLSRARGVVLDVPGRLVTLTGTGGVGKTWLAIAVAESVSESFVDGVWFVDFAPLTDSSLVLATVAHVLAAPTGESDPLLGLVAHLRQKRALLILDNFERVLTAAGQVDDLIARCPSLTILITSREPLRLQREVVLPLRPLALPNLKQPQQVAELATIASVALFVERAQAVSPDFVLNNANAGSVAELCVRLDGLPLAIRLAAARSTVLSPAAMLTRLRARLPLPLWHASDLPARHQTVNAAIDWSYDLLDPAHRALFRRLSVFAGGFDLAAVREIADTDALGVDVLDAVTALVDKRLVDVVERRDDGPRLGLLETIAEYGCQQLALASETTLTRDRHLAYYLAAAEAAEPRLRGAEQRTTIRRLQEENGNLRRSLSWALDSGRTVRGLRLASALARFWWMGGHVTEGQRYLDRALALAPDAPAGLLARGLYGKGILAHVQGHQSAAMESLEQSLGLARASQDLGLTAQVLTMLGTVVSRMGFDDRALDLHRESLALCRQRDDPWRLGMALFHLGMTTLQHGQAHRATEILDEALAILQRLGDEHYAIWTLAVLADVKERGGCSREATALLGDAVALCRRYEDWSALPYICDIVAVMTSRRGEPTRAASLLGAADSLREIVGWWGSDQERDRHTVMVANLREILGADRFTGAWDAGRSSTPALVVLDALAEVGSGAGDKHWRESVSRRNRGETLSGREKEVLRLVAHGRSNKEIGRALSIAETTARFHVSSILGKLGVGNRAEAVAVASLQDIL